MSTTFPQTRPVRSTVAIVGALAGALMVSSPALAHTGLPTSAADGVLHPLRGIDHLLAMVAVGVVAATAKDRRLVWLAPAGFLAGMLFGGIAGIAGLGFPAVEAMIAASVVVLGVLIVTGTRISGLWLPVLAAAFGAAHGHAHGAELPAGTVPVVYVAGFLAVTAALHLAGTLAGVAFRRVEPARILSGAAVSSAGAMLLLGA